MGKSCCWEYSWPNQLGKFCWKCWEYSLKMLLWANLFGILAKFWNCYLGKLLFGNLGEPFESIILGKLGKSWENFTWENFIWENWEFLIWENCVAHICWTKSWKNFIWKILNIWLGKFYLGKFWKYYLGKFCCPCSVWLYEKILLKVLWGQIVLRNVSESHLAYGIIWFPCDFKSSCKNFMKASLIVSWWWT